MFFDMHADLWTDNLWEYEKGKNDVIRRKYKDRFIEGGVFGGIFVIYLNAFKDPKLGMNRMLSQQVKEGIKTGD